MKRESIKVMTPVKQRIEMVKKELNVKTESEAIAYLFLYHDRHFEQITVKESKKLLEDVKIMHAGAGQMNITEILKSKGKLT
jgi:hypothetical protein